MAQVPAVLHHSNLCFPLLSTHFTHANPPPSSLSLYLSFIIIIFHFQYFSDQLNSSYNKLAEIKRALHRPLTMPPRRYAFGRADEATHPDSIRAALAEFISTFIFVFAGEGSILALRKIYTESTVPLTSASELIVMALANAFALFAAISASINISGGHVNPAVTFGALLGGRISVVRTIFYWIAQILGSVVASLLLRFVTVGMRTVGFHVAPGVSPVHGLILEIIMTFGLVYTVYATAIDPKRGSMGTIAPLSIGLLVGANVLVGGPFDGAAMNPARAFGPALLGWRWKHHWIYWIGPLLGGGLAGLVYEYTVIPTEPPLHTHQPLAPEDY